MVLSLVRELPAGADESGAMFCGLKIINYKQIVQRRVE